MTGGAGLGGSGQEWEPPSRPLGLQLEVWRGGDPDCDNWEGPEACPLKIGRDWALASGWGHSRAAREGRLVGKAMSELTRIPPIHPASSERPGLCKGGVLASICGAKRLSRTSQRDFH